VNIGVYKYDDAEFNHSHEYLLPSLIKVLRRYVTSANPKLFDLGCGNGATMNLLNSIGYSVVGVDPSTDGVTQAKMHYPEMTIEFGDSSEKLSERFGNFDVVYSLEVIEHVFDPYEYIQQIYSLLGDKGICILSTPYHGYFKNLVISLLGKWDKHFTVLWQGGHIKFWSKSTIMQLLQFQGFELLEILRVGRVPILAKSMIVIARKI
jgi:2-polyprenyl-6-hydroxyphenyl methylase/3-demethylubiquinone-9 3-methyltransferase